MDHSVFINYRGVDSPGYGTLLYNELARRFGVDRVFMDCESIRAGENFVVALLEQVRSARVVLAVIGPHWLTVSDSSGRRRLDDPQDWTRRELAEALSIGIPVIPVLTDLATLPTKTELPADIAALSECQYRHLRRREANSDLARLITDLTSLDTTLAEIASGRADVPPQQLNPADRFRHNGILRLSWESGDTIECVLETDDFAVSFGRSAANRVRLPDHRDSRFHGHLALIGTALVYQHLGSKPAFLVGPTHQLTINKGESCPVGDKDRLHFASGTMLVEYSAPDLYDPNVGPTSTTHEEDQSVGEQPHG